jgi:phytoene synthase
LGALAARILGGDDNAAIGLAAEHAGIAIATTGLLRSFARHASRQQLHIPAEVLDRHGARVEHIFAGRATTELREALADLRGEARRHVEVFEAMLPQLPAASVPAFLPAALVPGYLSAMDRPGYDPFRSAVEIPQWRRQWTLWRAARRYSRAMRG